MSHIYYVLYTAETLEINGLSGSPFDVVPKDKLTCKVYEKDGEDLMELRKLPHNYLVKIDADGYAKFIHRYLYAINNRFNSRSVIDNNIIQDLNYQIIFFDYIAIKYSYDGTTIQLDFNLSQLDTQYRENFENTDKGQRDIYITQYQNPSALLSKFVLDLNKLITNTTMKIPFESTQQISLWG